jgi:polyisoprenoid-binding protein YceI
MIIAIAAVCAVCVGALAPALRAQEAVFDLCPATTKIDFTLSATLHTVHGTFKLKSGEIRFDPATGKASGSVIVDATSGDTDNSSRDKNMHAAILESAKFPEIVFTPTRVKGTPDLKALSQGAVQGTAQVEVSGVFHLHGQDHEMALTLSVQPGAGGSLDVSTQFIVPYIKWGLKSPNTFFLKVGDTVNVDVHTTAHLASPSR